jgi:hypothetical protein
MNRDLGVWTNDDCALVLIDYQPELFESIRSETDRDLVELHVRLLARAAKAFEMPIPAEDGLRRLTRPLRATRLGQAGGLLEPVHCLAQILQLELPDDGLRVRVADVEVTVVGEEESPPPARSTGGSRRGSQRLLPVRLDESWPGYEGTQRSFVASDAIVRTFESQAALDIEEVDLVCTEGQPQPLSLPDSHGRGKPGDERHPIVLGSAAAES